MKSFVITPLARTDLLEIWHYLAERASVSTANRIVAEIYDTIQMLAEQPGMGHVRADVTDLRYRFWRIHRYMIAYRSDRKPLTIARVIHGARDFKKIFE
jgi:toxin ParE1/3/4